MSNLHTYNSIALAALLNEALFDSKQTSSGEPEKPNPPIRFLGGNKKHIVFILKDDSNIFFSEPAEAAFIKTLQALSLQLEDVAVLNISHQAHLELDAIKKALTPAYIIFLTDSESIFKDIRLEKNVSNHIDNIGMLNTYAFEEMLLKPERKKAFWPALKNLLLPHG